MTQYITEEYNMSGQEILDMKMSDNDAGASTIREYLKALLVELWAEGESFSGKRPFGNSGWEDDLYNTLEAAGYDPSDYNAIDTAIFDAIEALQ